MASEEGPLPATGAEGDRSAGTRCRPHGARGSGRDAPHIDKPAADVTCRDTSVPTAPAPRAPTCPLLLPHHLQLLPLPGPWPRGQPWRARQAPWPPPRQALCSFACSEPHAEHLPCGPCRGHNVELTEDSAPTPCGACCSVDDPTTQIPKSPSL